MENEIELVDESWKRKVLLVGGVVGLLVGVTAGILLIQRSERENTTPQMSGGEGVKVGLLVLGLLRQITQLAD